MEWSAEVALNELWSGLDTSQTNGEVRRYLKQRLEAAFDAGRNQEVPHGDIAAEADLGRLR